MKICFLLISLVCISVIVNSQVPASVTSLEDASFNDGYAGRSIPIVTGRLINIPAEELKNITISYTLVTPFAESQKRKTTLPQPDGSFRLEIDYAFPYQQIWFSVGDLFRACLYTTEDLDLKLDIKKMKTVNGVQYIGDGVSYQGKDGPLNSYLNNYILYKKEERQRLGDKMALLNPSSPAMINNTLVDYNKLSDSLKKIENDYIAINPSPYGWILENERMSEYYAQILTWYFGTAMDESLWQKIKRHKSYFVSNGTTFFYKYLYMYLSMLPGKIKSASWKDIAKVTDLDIAEEKAIDSLTQSETMKPAYPYTLENIKMWERVLRPRIQKLSMFRFIDNTIHTVDSMLPVAKADLLKFQLNTSNDLQEQKEILDYLHGYVHTSWCASVIEKESRLTSIKINETNKTLAASGAKMKAMGFGTPVMETTFGASLYKASAIEVTDFLNKLKQSFAGKAIVVDIWATWCVPCLAEMEHGKQLSEQSKDLPVVFVYLCTLSESSENKWKSKIAELKQPGIHILIDQTLDKELFRYFSFTGYPSHLLIDKSGNYHADFISRINDINDRKALSALINK